MNFTVNFLPRTLGGRTLLLVIATVLLAEAATFFVLDIFRQSYVAQRGADTVVGYIRVIQSAVEAMPPAARRQFAAQASAEDRVRVVAYAQVIAPEREPSSAMRREMAVRIRKELGSGTAVRSAIDQRGIANEMWVGFSAAGEPWWLVVPSGRLEMPLPWALLGILAGVVAAAMLLGAAFIRGIVRPLRALEEATGALGAGHPRPVTPGGPQETRVLAERFNLMLNQLDANEREHTVMLASLPHDLRAPLTRLRLRLALLDEETRAGLQRDADDIDHIAQQFIDYLRGVWGDENRHTPVVLLALLEARAAHYRQLGYRVTAHGDAALSMPADVEALKRLLDNLIDNALRYGAEPVELSVNQHTAGIRITVRDYGPGIPPEEAQRALQPFTRLESARSGSGHCGLGLAIVERIARSHAGTLALESPPDGGLRVSLVLCCSNERSIWRKNAAS